MARYSRFRSLTLASTLLMALGLTGCDNNASQQTKAPEAAKQSPEASVNLADLLKPGELPDQILGNANAPVTIVEYASMTCTHCATFHTETFEHLKEKYIDTGKVRLIFREFPLDPLAYAGALLARCSGEGRYFPMLSLLFKQQRSWAYAEKPEAALFDVAKQAGFTRETFDACLQDQKSYDALRKIRQRASETYGVNSTPSFFINGKIQRGAMTPQQLDAAIAAAIGGK